MRKFILLTLLPLISIPFIISQPRVDNPTFILSQPFALFDGPLKGWDYSSYHGKWTGHDNSIGKIDSHLNLDNIISLEFRNFNFKGKDYLVLVKKMKRRDVEIITSKNEWERTVFKDFIATKKFVYILNYSDYISEMLNFVYKSIDIIKIPVLGQMLIEDYADLSSWCDHIMNYNVAGLRKNNIEYNQYSIKEKYTTYTLNIYYKKESADLFRFFLFHESCLDNATMHIEDYNTLYPPGYNNKPKKLSKKNIKKYKQLPFIYGQGGMNDKVKIDTNELLKTIYYETDRNIFEKFILSPVYH